MYCLFYFLFHSTCFEGKEKSGIFGGFYCFFKWASLKKTSVFLVGSNYINPEDNCGRLIDFLSKIAILSYCNVLDIAHFMMHH